MQQIETIEAARKLSEEPSSFFETSVEIQSDGTKIKKDKVRPLVAQSVSENSIMFFRDNDGRLMEVVYTKEGPIKVEVI